MTVHFAPPRAADRIHATVCACVACRADRRRHRDPRERLVRAVTITVAGLIGGALGILVTPQAIVATIAATL